MADMPGSADPNLDLDDDHASTPKWVYVFGVVAVVFVVAFVAFHLIGGGFHGHTMP